ncbi:GNAT family N-acetyltransferase [Nocardioides daphniae]|uniref:N-acetyltransferase n=1 Tax=Nocardioides daphniae TaxID=402297 RepID=A0ABQ1Q3K5_9ACTN|nr:GNAT family N-acetyltransferase [Nocardioides daphniae]GGD11742.1 N-acetyltransferase [Nocardioides daphniae]
MTTLETPRLRLTPVTSDDVPFFAELWQDPEVMAHLGGVRDPERIVPLVAEAVEQWRTHGLGRWVVRLAAQSIGTIKLAHVMRGRSEIEIGYALLPGHEGRGYATEACECVLNFALQDRSFPSVVALARDGNDSSLAVLDRLGFVREGSFEHPLGPHMLFRVTRPRWLDRT